MSIKIRNYTNEAGYSKDFHRVCDFLIRINGDNIVTPNYLWARWVWQFGPYMNMKHLSLIGIAEDDNLIVGLATYEGDIDEVYFCIDEKYPEVKEMLIDYALEKLANKVDLKISLPDGDSGYRSIAIQKGFIPTTEKSVTARIDIDGHTYSLPEGYRIMSFDEEGFDIERYYNAIWRGFNNQRLRNEIEMESMKRREGFDAPHFDLNLRILVVAPNGDYAAHCGMWYIPGSKYAYVEPVFTLPEYRRIGLGKAAVIEGIVRCSKLGAKQAYVLSSQQFYYNIGFYPFQNETWWSYQHK